METVIKSPISSVQIHLPTQCSLAGESEFTFDSVAGAQAWIENHCHEIPRLPGASGFLPVVIALLDVQFANGKSWIMGFPVGSDGMIEVGEQPETKSYLLSEYITRRIVRASTMGDEDSRFAGTALDIMRSCELPCAEEMDQPDPALESLDAVMIRVSRMVAS